MNCGPVLLQILPREVIIHEHFNIEGGLKNRPRRGPPVWAEANDIALVHLATAVVLGPNIIPVCLPLNEVQCSLYGDIHSFSES